MKDRDIIIVTESACNTRNTAALSQHSPIFLGVDANAAAVVDIRTHDNDAVVDREGCFNLSIHWGGIASHVLSGLMWSPSCLLPIKYLANHIILLSFHMSKFPRFDLAHIFVLLLHFQLCLSEVHLPCTSILDDDIQRCFSSISIWEYTNLLHTIIQI